MERKCKRFLSLLLAAFMVIGLMPVSVLAAENTANTIQLSLGQTYTFEGVPGDLTGDNLPQINTAVASVTAVLDTSADGEIMGGDAKGTKVPLADAAHVFETTETANTYYIYIPDYTFANGATDNCYLSSFNGGHTQTETTSLISSTGADDGSVYIYTSNSTGARYLFIERSTMAWNKVTATAGFEQHCTFYIYGAVEDASESSEELYGYKKITNLADIESGEKYLIAFYSASNELYVVDVAYMTAAAYGQMLKADAGLTTDITVKAEGVGNTSLTIGGTTYTIVVAATPAEAADLTVTARYITNRLAWNAAEGETYTVQRSADGKAWSDLGTASGSYIDETASLNTQYFYRLAITSDGETSYTEAKQAAYKTGMEALKATAALFYADNDETTFNGSNKVTIAEGEEAAALSAMNEGTIVYKANFADVSGKKAVLGTDTGCFVGGSAGKFRHELGGLNGETGYTGMTAGTAVTAGFIYNDANGHWALCFGNNSVTSVELNPANFGLLAATNATTYYAGGSSNYSFTGTINYILVTSEVLTDEELETLTAMNQDHDAVDVTLPEPALGEDIGEMLEISGEDDRSNSWMFDGGSTTAGSFTEIGGIRSYVYQFEEYVRWIRRGGGVEWPGRQRYTINVGKAGQTLADSLDKFDQRAEELDPRAAVYLVGAEDYNAGQNGIEDFKTNLAAYIAKAVTLRGNTGFAVIQTPYPNDSSENDELYAQAVADTLSELPSEIKGRVVLADHNAAEGWGADDYNADGSLSGLGHYEMGKQLSLAVCGTNSGYQSIADLTAVAAPASYSDEAPTVSSENNALVISGLADIAWTVEIALDSYTLTVNTAGPVLVFEDLPAGESYTLTITAADLSVRMPIMEGTVNGSAQPYAPERNANQQAIAQLVSGSEPVTWLFMGDSITHGAAHTYGYDSVTQVFEKFLKDDLGRTDDIVINTAVSSASTPDAISEIESRLNRYQPDVVSIMLGTNDSAASVNTGETAYKANLRTLIDAAKAKGAKVLLRTPVPTKDGTRPEIGNYDDWMGQVAEEYTDVILVEQYDSMSAVFTAAPYMRNVLFHSNDYLHPTTEGQIWMCSRFLEAAGLYQDGYMTNLEYETGAANTVSDITPNYVISGNSVSLNTAALAENFGQALYTVKLTATDAGGNVYSAEGVSGETLTLSNLPEEVTFSTEARVANSGAKVSFGVPETIDVVLFPGRSATYLIPGTGMNTDDLDGRVANVECNTTLLGQSGTDNTFSGDYVDMADCLYTFDRQDDGTWYISATTADGKTLYVDPHAGAGNGGYPSRSYETPITLVDSVNGAVKLYQEDGGYLHFWDNDDSKLYWDQCTADGNHTGHNLLIYRAAEGDETASEEIPGYVKVNGVSGISDGGKYLIVGHTNSGGYYVMRPTSDNSSKYLHLAKIYGEGSKLTVNAVSAGNTSVTVDDVLVNIRVEQPEEMTVTLDYGYDVADSTVTAISGDTLGDLKIPVPMREGYTFFGWNLNGSKVTSSYIITGSVTLTADWVTVATKEKPANGTTTNGQPFPETDANGAAYCYRIPGIVTLADGTVVAMADARWTTWADCGGLDTIISASRDNGKTWEYTYANYLGDNGDVYNPWSTTFIDPAIATDGETVYMIADLFPAGVSTMANGYASQAGSGGFNTDGKLMLRDLAGDTYKIGNSNEKSAYISMATSRPYDFYLDPNGDGTYTIRKESDDSAVTGYTVDEFLNITSTDGTVDTHLFMADSPYQVYPTNYLYLTTSEDGLNWSAPELIVAKNASENAFLIGPGSGTYDDVNNNIVFTAYSYPNQLTALLWAGEDGVWHRSEAATTSVWSSEAAPVVLEDGTIRVFYRSASSVLCYTDYIWRDGEYVRDVNNTSVSTGAAKNGGNGCMLTAVMYPEKVNGRELILVATPTVSNSRADGHIYAFYVNADGSVELASDYDITAGAAEYYAYSCMTVLTQGEEKGDLALFWEDSWNSSPAAATIHYDVIDMVDVLPAIREVIQKNVTLKVGETASFEDNEDYYVGADTKALNTEIASVEITGTVTESALTADTAVTEIESGEQYVIVNTRAAKTLTNGTAATSAAAGAGSGLSLSGNTANIAASAIWTIEGADGSYTVKDANGKYLSIVANGASVGEAAANLSIVRNGNTWIISQNGAYLNDFGGGGTCAAGWQDGTAAGDAGSQWTIHKIKEVPTGGTSVISFTGIAPGTTSVQIGFINYNIKVEANGEPEPVAPVVTGAAADPTKLTAEGGKVTVTITGTDLEDGIDIKAGDLTAKTSGTATEQTATLTIPANETEEEVTYTIQYSLDGETYTGEIKVTVAAAEEEKPAPSDPDDTDPKPSEPEDNDPKPSEPEEDEPKYELPECGMDDDCVLSQFSDVKIDDWYHDGVHFCVDHGIVNGMGNGTFAPNDPTTRAQLVTMLYRLEGEPSIDGLSEPFTDVSENDWFYAPIVWAYNNKVVNGMTETTFAPDAKITREQVATILHRYLGTPAGSGDLSGYPDADKVQDYAKDALTWAVGEGLINGVAQTDGTSLLAPDGNATRAQIATILMRYLTA